LASLLPAETDSEEFIKNLGIVRHQAVVANDRWTLVDSKLMNRLQPSGEDFLLEVDKTVLASFEKEQARRSKNRELISVLEAANQEFSLEPMVQLWKSESQPLKQIHDGETHRVVLATSDPAGVKDKIEFAKRSDVTEALGGSLRWDDEDSYGYSRAFATPIAPISQRERRIVLDPTAGGGSIPFEALRLGYKVIANELNPVASVILAATLDYPVRFGKSLLDDIKSWGELVRETVEEQMLPFTPFSPIPLEERSKLVRVLEKHPELVDDYATEHDQMGLLYCRQVTCPHCQGDAPLLNSQWLAKSGEKWGVAVKPQSDKTVRFEPFRVGSNNLGPNGENLDSGTITRGVGQCVHCQQAINSDEIKRQARGESELGTWRDELYCVVGIRVEPKVDKNGQVQRTKSGPNAGQIKTSKLRYFRAANETDRQAIQSAAEEMDRRLLDFEVKGLVPNDRFPKGNDMRPVNYGMPTWADMFTSRQLLGHLTVMEAIHNLKPQIMEELGDERGRAVITYLQFMLDKITDYNSRQTRWEYTRGVIKGGFGRHDFSLKWTFGEMVYAGPSSGLRWAISQIVDAYASIAELVQKRHDIGLNQGDLVQIKGSAASMPDVENHTVDAVVMDPPYYNNVQYSELSDFYYVWQKRTLGDLYPDWFGSGITDKEAEAVANPARDGGAKPAKARYEELMQSIFSESKRVLKPDGIMTLMFTHKSPDAWETLTNALIQSGWDITACMPVESESGYSTHQMNMASAASTIFIACRPANREDRMPSSWAYEVKGKLEKAVREGLVEFDKLKLNPVDRMIASWGRALRVYSEHWPVQDGDEEVPPTRAMQEAARVVAEEEVRRLSGGMVTVDDLDSETRLAVIALGINGLGDFAYDDALQMSRSLNFRLQLRNGNYRVNDEMVAYANEGEDQIAAPLAIKGNKLRLLKPEERSEIRLENPQTLWDVLTGLIVIYRDGGIVAARNFLAEHGKTEKPALRGLLKVWAKECRDDALRREAQLIDYEL
jgi:adenine-specific DNA methylase